MTTDITELAQSLKAAAVRAQAATEEYASRRISSTAFRLEIEEFESLANKPANILALVEALEKAQGMETYWKTQCRGITDHCEELQAQITKLTSENAALKGSVENAAGCINAAYAEGLVDAIAESSDERLVDLVKRRLLHAYLPVETPATDDVLVAMGDTVLLEQLEDSRKAIVSQSEIIDLQDKRIAELESRTVKPPPELYTIGELIRTQDNRITDQPMFVVFQKREIIGSDEHSPSRICWVWDGEEVSELRAKRLEALYQDGRDTRGYDRYAMQEVDEFVTACFTEHGCKDYLRQNGHNLRQPYIYACGSFRNNEYQLVRNWLAGIKWEGE